ncbi:MAG TPA: ribonuclease Z [Flavobacteriales bacterium]|nr:ribonuclease Z [Flavobacteriales bacterium]
MAHRRFELLTLGTGAAMPARGRFPSSQLLNVHEGLYMIDCGEGTQERLRVAAINIVRIEHVFISHLHGDHYLGLMGLMSSMHLVGRTSPLHVHGPALLKEVIDLQLRASGTYLRYPFHFHALEPQSGTVVWEDKRVIVRVLALKHRLPCTGFVFEERPGPRLLRKDKLAMIPTFKRGAIKIGLDLQLNDGVVVPNDELTLDPPPPRRYAYCSDTAYEPALIPFIKDVDLLYHEATFTEALKKRAKETMHSTAGEAARLALAANVGQLLLGHFSSRYKSADELLAEALPIFPRTALSCEGGVFPLIERSIV